MSTVDGLLAPADVADDADPGPRRPKRRGPGGSDVPAFGRRARWAGWLFALPALIMFVVFELCPIITSIQYSFYDWDGIGASTPSGLKNYTRVFSEPQLVASIIHS